MKVKTEKKSFVRTARMAAAVFVSALLLLSLAGCSGTNADAEVASTAINQSPENAARVFAKAAYSATKICCSPVSGGLYGQSDRG
jgi:ABC-type uncharacterized transport system auxiliary subunit